MTIAISSTTLVTATATATRTILPKQQLAWAGEKKSSGMATKTTPAMIQAAAILITTKAATIGKRTLATLTSTLATMLAVTITMKSASTRDKK